MCGIQGDPVEVLPWLYIGSASHASCDDRLAACGISALLNMADTRHDNAKPTTSGIDRKRLCHVDIAVADSCSSDIGCWFPQAIDFIGQSLCKYVNSNCNRNQHSLLFRAEEEWRDLIIRNL